jgi:hypothetical protein
MSGGSLNNNNRISKEIVIFIFLSDLPTISPLLIGIPIIFPVLFLYCQNPSTSSGSFGSFSQPGEDLFLSQWVIPPLE